MNSYVIPILLLMIMPGMLIETSTPTVKISTLIPENHLSVGIIDSTKSCLECHEQTMAGETKHSPAEKDCMRCHVLEASEHPIDGQVSMALSNSGADLCYECHLPKNEETNVHTPTAEGKCLTCHSPHSSSATYLVTEDKASDLCLSCHELATPAGHNVHQAVSDGACTSCHNPHQSDEPHLLASKRLGRLCGSCHKDIRSDRNTRANPPSE